MVAPTFTTRTGVKNERNNQRSATDELGILDCGGGDARLEERGRRGAGEWRGLRHDFPHLRECCSREIDQAGASGGAGRDSGSSPGSAPSGSGAGGATGGGGATRDP